MSLSSRIERHWFAVPAAIALASQVLLVARRFLLPGRPAIDVDAALFEHAGWYVTQGAIPYVHIWDPKPPLTIETTTILALLTRGDMLALHLLSVLLTSVAAVGVVLLTTLLAFELSGSRLAGIAAGLTLLTLPAFYTRPAYGFRPKYWMLLFGLLSIWLQVKKRPYLSGASAVASTAYYLLGSVFAGIALALAVMAREWRRFGKTLFGMALFATLVLLPIVVWGALVPMFVEVVVAPAVVGEDVSVWVRLSKSIEYLGFAYIPVLAGSIGLLVATYRDPRRAWWALAGGLGFSAKAFLLDLDGVLELFGLLLFASLGVGLLTKQLSRKLRRALLIILAVVILVNPLWLRGLMIASRRSSTTDVREQGAVDPRRGLPSMSDIYWGKLEPHTCHYRLSEMEVGWIERTGRSYDERECGHVSLPRME